MKTPTKVVPITTTPAYPDRDQWPQFEKAAKPALQSPFKTVMCFGESRTESAVRIIVEGRNQAAVDEIARKITGL